MSHDTRRLFHEDAYLRRFEATVLECRSESGGAVHAILDRTAFYATSGGQPHDLGLLGGAAVLDVVDRDGIIEHRVDRPLSGVVTGEIDWARRFDHMRQHTGQHILSQAFIETAGAETVSFHLGAEKVTIDLSRGDLSPADLAGAEARANGIVGENRPVVTHWTTREEVHRFPLRKPPKVDGRLRIVEVKDFDWSACGGTHVAATGEIGLIKVLRAERYKGGARVEFLCGGRAIEDYAWKHDLVRRTAERFSTLDRDLGPAIERLEEEARDLRRRLRVHAEAALDREASNLARSAEPRGAVRLVRHFKPDTSPEDLKGLAARLRALPCLAAFLAGKDPDGRAHLVFARSDDVAWDVSKALRAALPHIEGRGGGRPEMAQGSGARAQGIEAALAAAVDAMTGGDGA